MGAGNYLEEAVLNHFFRNQNLASPAQIFIALYKTDPTDSDTGTEISGGGYARKQLTFSAPVQTSGKGTISNSIEIIFPKATGDWGTITHFGIRTALAGGSLLAFGTVPVPKTILEDDELRYEVGAITVTVD